MRLERLTDIIDKDLNDIFYYYRDLTHSLTIQCGSYKAKIMASLQADTMTADASADPINAYSLTVFCLEKDLSENIKKALSKDSLIYLNGVPHKVVDTTVDLGRLRRIAVEKRSSRGKITPRPLTEE